MLYGPEDPAFPSGQDPYYEAMDAELNELLRPIDTYDRGVIEEAWPHLDATAREGVLCDLSHGQPEWALDIALRALAERKTALPEAVLRPAIDAYNVDDELYQRIYRTLRANATLTPHDLG